MPLEVKNIVSSPFVRGHVEHRPHALISYFGNPIPEVPSQWFKDNILPALPEGLDSAQLIRKLRKNGHIVNKRWSVLSRNLRTPNQIKDVVYMPFANVAALIGQTAKTLLPDREQVVAFQCNPHPVPISNFRENYARPDGYGVYEGHVNYQPRDNHGIFWEFIVAPGEMKINNSNADINDNVEKILWSFSHIMRDDPSRRFVIGYTIESTDMRLWFCSRTEIIVTRPFDFVRDHETVSHFILSQMYAKAHELGYDTTMSTPTDTQLRAKNQWDITVHPVVRVEEAEGAGAESIGKKIRAPDVTFRTTKLISSIGAEGVRSRGTRVWQAQQLVAGKMQPTEMVMKDYWVDSNRVREADIWLKILKDAPTARARTLLKRHLLTPLYSGDVMIDGQEDTTHALRRFSTLPACKGMKMIQLLRSSTKITDNDSIVTEDQPFASRGSGAMPQGPAALPGDKSHHRIVFKERGVTIEHLTTVSQVLRAGMQALKALETMHKSGWVHRDISSGNILIVGDIVKIADLEYAKSMNDDSSHSERSGTALFMSIEAGYHKYKFRSIKTDENEDSETYNLDNEADHEPIFGDTKLAVPQLRASAKPKPPAQQSVFRYNPLHDIESLWWLLVYLLLYRSPVIKGYTSSDIASQSLFYRPFFVPGDTRWSAFADASEFVDHGSRLHELLHPVSDTLDSIRRLLVHRYIEVERGDLSKIDHTVAASLIPRIMHKLEKLEAMYAEGDVELSPIRSSRLQRDVEPPTAAATVGISLDSRQLLDAKKRALSDLDKPVKAEDPVPDVAEGRTTKRARRGRKTSSSDESASPARRGGVSLPRRRTRSSGSSHDNAPLRRSQREKKPVKR